MFSNMLDKLTESIVKSVCICVVQRKAFGGGGLFSTDAIDKRWY